MKIKCSGCGLELIPNAYTTKMHEGRAYSNCATCGALNYFDETSEAQPLVVEKEEVVEVVEMPKPRTRKTPAAK